jgi:serine phosphatase RsbU (regulator of sigma subunit)
LTTPRIPPALDDALRPLEAVHRLMAALHRAASPAGFYHEAVDAVVTTLGVDRASLLLFDPDGVMRFKAWRGLSDGYRRAVEGHTPWTPEDTDARPILVPDVTADPELAGYVPTFRAEGIGALAFVPLLAGGRVVGKFMLYYDRPHDFSPAEIAVAEILAANVALLLERHRSDEAERAARAEADAAHARLVSLQRVTTELAGAVSVADVAAVVLGTALREVGATTGSLCLIDGDELEIAYAVGYPTEVMGRWGRFPLDAALPASEAARTGRAVFLHSPAERDERYPIFAASPVVPDKAYAMMPLHGERPLGCLVIGFPEPRPFLQRDEPFFTELAARCAAALERARLFDDRERALAAEAAARQATERAHRELQATLLPPELPEIAGVDLAARYSAAGTGIDVGGDFYDVFPLDSRRFVAVLGDVCGRGLPAATLAAHARYTIRSAAVTAADPSAILAHLNEVLLRRQEPGVYEPQFCTALVAVVEPEPGGIAVELAVAGHPLPMHVAADGSVTAVGVPGSLLGVSGDATAPVATLKLRPGEALVCVTDGVLERRHGPSFFGEAGLAAALAEARDGDAEGMAAAVEAATLAFSPDETSDDFAVLILLSPPPDGPARPDPSD